MSELSFKTFCIEFYSKHIQKPGPEVYELFRTSGLLDMLETDYEDLHGMGMEALMQFFDEYLAKELKEIQLSAFPIIEHNLVRATVTPEIIRGDSTAITPPWYNFIFSAPLQDIHQKIA